MLTAHIHPRLGLDKFLKFEPFFLAALEAFDKDGSATVFSVDGGLSPTTIAARMRDSLQGYRLNQVAWKDQVNPRFAQLMAKHDGQFVIAGPDTEGRVMLRHRRMPNAVIFNGPTFHQASGNLPKYIRTTHVKPSDNNSPVLDPTIKAPNCDEATVRALVLVKTQGLAAPVIFPGALTTRLCDELSSVHDVAFHYDAERNETVMM